MARISDRLDEEIRRFDKFLLVLSENSIKSQWVEHEVETALLREREEESNTIILPIRLDDAIYEIKAGWPAYIRNTRNIGDFTCERTPVDYLEPFSQLLWALKRKDKE